MQIAGTFGTLLDAFHILNGILKPGYCTVTMLSTRGSAVGPSQLKGSVSIHGSI